MHSKLSQDKPKEGKHRKYAYKHAIHYAFQALPGQAKRTQTPEIAYSYAFQRLTPL